MRDWDTIALVGLLLLSACGHRRPAGASQAYRTYLEFATAIGGGDCERMNSLLEGPARRNAASLCGLAKAVYVRPFRSRPDSPKGPVSVKRTLESETGGGGEVIFKVVERPLESHEWAMLPSSLFHHSVTLRQWGGEWKIVDFELY